MNMVGILITILVAALVYVLLRGHHRIRRSSASSPRSWSCMAGIPSGGFGLGARFGGQRRRACAERGQRTREAGGRTRTDDLRFTRALL